MRLRVSEPNGFMRPWHVRVAGDISQPGVAESPGCKSRGTARGATLVPATPVWEIWGLAGQTRQTKGQ